MANPAKTKRNEKIARLVNVEKKSIREVQKQYKFKSPFSVWRIAQRHLKLSTHK